MTDRVKAPASQTRSESSSTSEHGASSRKDALRGLSYADQMAAVRPVQMHGGGGHATPGAVQEAATHGVSGAGGALPHLDQIQQSFGRHDVSGVKAHVGGRAAEATRHIGADAYATDGQVAFGHKPDLFTAAHEAAHVVQQRGGVQLLGGVGQAGDQYEAHADRVAEQVVAGKSAESLLDQMAPGGGASSASAGAVQRKESKAEDTDDEGPTVIEPTGGIEGGVGTGDIGVKAKTSNDGKSVEAGADIDMAALLAKKWPAVGKKLEAFSSKLTFSKNFSVGPVPMYVKVAPEFKVGGSISVGKERGGKVQIGAAGVATLGVGVVSTDFIDLEVGAYGSLALKTEVTIGAMYDSEKDQWTISPFQLDVKAEGKIGMKAQVEGIGPDISKTLAEWDLATISVGGYANGGWVAPHAKPGKDLLRLIAFFQEKADEVSKVANNAKAWAKDGYDYLVDGETETDRLWRESMAHDERVEKEEAEKRKKEGGIGPVTILQHMEGEAHREGAPLPPTQDPKEQARRQKLLADHAAEVKKQRPLVYQAQMRAGGAAGQKAYKEGVGPGKWKGGARALYQEADVLLGKGHTERGIFEASCNNPWLFASGVRNNAKDTIAAYDQAAAKYREGDKFQPDV